MLVGALLVLALACLCVGLFLTSSIWLVGSLAASMLAGLLIYRPRAAGAIFRLSAMSRTRAGPTGEASPGTRAGPGGRRPDPAVWVVAGRPRYHRQRCQIICDQDAGPIRLSQAREDGLVSCSLCQPAE